MKKIMFIIALALACVFMLAACAPQTDPAPAPTPEATPEAAPETTPEPETGLANPFVEVASYQELTAACPDIAISDAPEGSTAVKYSYCQTDGAADFAQIDFSLGGDTYQYRAKASDAEPAADDTLHGYFYEFANDETVEQQGHLSYRLRTAEGETEASTIGVATWYNPALQCQYSLTTQTSQDAATVINAVAPLFTQTDF